MEIKVSPTETNTKEYVPTYANDPLPSGEDRMQLKELMELFTQLLNKVLDLENEIKEIESKVEKLKEKNMSLTKELKSFNTRVESLTIKETVMDKEESSKQGKKIADIDAATEDVVKDVEDVVATAKNVKGINAATIPQISKNDVTLAQTLIEIKAAKPKAKRLRTLFDKFVHNSINSLSSFYPHH
nr:hypothetical protein [Tanacetum cinerariifolium]